MDATAKSNTRNRVDQALWLYTLLLFVFTISAWASYAANGHPPLRRPLLEFRDRFADLTAYIGKISHLNQGAAPLVQGYPVYNYPAPAAYVYAFFLRGFPSHPMRAYVVLLGAAVAFGAFLVWRAARDSSTWPLMAATMTTGLLGFPLILPSTAATSKVWSVSSWPLASFSLRRPDPTALPSLSV